MNLWNFTREPKDLVVIELVVSCGSIQLGPETILEVETWIGNHQEVAEQVAAWRMGWTTLGRGYES